MLALLGAHPILHVSKIRVNVAVIRIVPFLDHQSFWITQLVEFVQYLIFHEAQYSILL
jgi:hypothetical protein